jgi:hypothetical protein
MDSICIKMNVLSPEPSFPFGALLVLAMPHTGGLTREILDRAVTATVVNLLGAMAQEASVKNWMKTDETGIGGRVRATLTEDEGLTRLIVCKKTHGKV